MNYNVNKFNMIEINNLYIMNKNDLDEFVESST